MLWSCHKRGDAWEGIEYNASQGRRQPIGSYTSLFAERPPILGIDMASFCINIFDYLVQACVRDSSPLRDKSELANIAKLLNQVSEECLEIR